MPAVFDHVMITSCLSSFKTSKHKQLTKTWAKACWKHDQPMQNLSQDQACTFAYHPIHHSSFVHQPRNPAGKQSAQHTDVHVHLCKAAVVAAADRDSNEQIATSTKSCGLHKHGA